MSVKLTYQAIATVEETLDTNVADAAATKAKITHDQWNKSATLTGTSTPPVSETASFEQALSSGTATIDLTALPGSGGGTIDGTGLKVQLLRLRNNAQANPISLTVGASNGYEGFGSDFKVTLSPGQEVTLYGNDATPDVGSGAKTLDLAGTGAQKLQVQIVLG